MVVDIGNSTKMTLVGIIPKYPAKTMGKLARPQRTRTKDGLCGERSQNGLRDGVGFRGLGLCLGVSEKMVSEVKWTRIKSLAAQHFSSVQPLELQDHKRKCLFLSL